MTDDTSEIEELLRRAKAGDGGALAQLFLCYRLRFSPTQAAVRAEMQLRLQDALNAMDPLDREVVVLRHFEELSNAETAAVLGIQKSAASKRYIRAIARLKQILDAIPGFFD